MTKLLILTAMLVVMYATTTFGTTILIDSSSAEADNLATLDFFTTNFPDATVLYGNYHNWADPTLTATINAADVLVLARSNSSTNYNGKGSYYNGLTTDVICFSTFFSRANYLGWESGGVAGFSPSGNETTVTEAGAVLFGGAGNFDWFSGDVTIWGAGTGTVGSGTILATVGGNHLVVGWKPGDTIASGAVQSGYRLLFNVSAGNLLPDTAAGQKALLDSVKTYTMLGGYGVAYGSAESPDPSDKAIVDLTALSSLSWQGSSEPNIVSEQYDLVFGTEPNMLLNTTYPNVTSLFNLTSHNIYLDYETTYYWRVVSHIVWDSNEITGSFQNTVEGPVWTFTTVPSMQANTCYIDGDDRMQMIDGFGFSTAWCGELSSAKNNALYETLGMSILRVHISETANWGYQTANSAAAHAAGAMVFGSPWSPPLAWKSNGLYSDGYLLPDHYGDYVNWLNSAADSIDLDCVSIQNEPENTGWCTWTPEQMHTFIRDYASGITVPVMMPEALGFNKNMSDPVLNDPVAVNNFAILGGHIYSRGPTVHTNGIAHGKPVWMTEHFVPDSQTDMANCIAIAKEMNDCMNCLMNAYIWWWVNEGDTSVNLVSNEGFIFKNGYTMGQFARWVRPGKQRIGSTYNPANGIYITAYDNDGVVIVAVNTNTSDVDQDFVLQNLDGVGSFAAYRTSSSQSMSYVGQSAVSNGGFTDQLPAQSVTTYVQTPFLTVFPGNRQVLLDWTESGDLNFASYNVYRSTTRGSGYTRIAAGVTVSEYLDTMVNNGTTYYYAVKTVDAYGVESGYSNEALATPSDPAAPLSLCAIAGDASISLDWTDNTELDLAGYNVKRAAASGGPYATIASNVTTSAYTDNAAVNGMRFHYVVTAVDASSNESANSNEASATPLGKYRENGGVLSMEAENGTMGSRWTIGADYGASNHAYLEIDSAYDDTSGSVPVCTSADCIVTYDFNISTGGNYRFWFRMYSSGGGDDSFFWRIDGDTWIQENNRSGIGAWFSRDNTQVDNLSTGNHVLEITYCENGTRLDKFVIKLDSLSSPSNKGPAESLRSDQADTATPASPTGLVAAAGNATVSLDWADSTEPDLASYSVYRSTTSGSYGSPLATGVALSAYTDNTAVNDTIYYYTVTAVDTSTYESSYSNEVTATPYDSRIVPLSAVDFETGFGDWVNISGDDSHDWTRNSGGTMTSNTGPAGGANGSTWYVYLETSPGAANKAGNTAILQGPEIGGYKRKLTFYYHMYGDNIGTLNVDVYDGTWHNTVWSRSGEQHLSGSEPYIKATVDLTGYTGPIQIRFRAVAAGGGYGDMAIDNIEVTGRRLYGDMNVDGIVNAGDLSEFLGYWLQNDCDLDLDGNCVIDLYEFAELAGNWLED